MKNYKSISILVMFFLSGCIGGSAPSPSIEGLSPAPVKKERAKMMYDEADDFSMQAQEEAPIEHNTEEYDKIVENEFKSPKQNPLSTFSIDVDTASYSNVRRYLNYSKMPPPNAVRIEEMINYFEYSYPDPSSEHPFSITTEIAECPWNKENSLIHIGIQGKKLDYENLKSSNLTFLLDSSGSMSDANKLPLLKKSLGLLLDNLTEKDRVAIVAYAGSAGLVLPSTPATEKNKILSAIDKLEAGGSTAGGEGIELAYKIAKENYIAGGNNRVILATDGDFNVGTSSTGELVDLISEKRKEKIFLTIIGLGMGNYKDGRMEQISNAGDGNYFYVDSIREAEKVFVKEMRANMFTIAKDVKIQIEFNPALVKGYRLIGYENRVMAAEDFDDDKKDAGELGAGHSVTALYEVIPAGSTQEVKLADDLKYQKAPQTDEVAYSDEIMTLKFRYKPLDSEKSKLIVAPVKNEKKSFALASENYRFSASVAAFGMLLRKSKFTHSASYDMVEELASSARGKDEMGYRSEFLNLVKTAKLLSAENEKEDEK